MRNQLLKIKFIQSAEEKSIWWFCKIKEKSMLLGETHMG